MNQNLISKLRTGIKNGTLTLPDGWTVKSAIACLDRLEKNYSAKYRGKGEVTTPWAEELGRKFDKFANAFSRLATVMSAMDKMPVRRIAKAKEVLDKETELYSNSLISGLLFGLGTRDLVNKNDLTLGMADKVLHQTKERTMARLREVEAKAKKKDMYIPYMKAIDAVLEMAKDQGEKGVYEALNAMADAFERKLQGIAGKRISPRADDKPPKRPTVDEDEESPFAEE